MSHNVQASEAGEDSNDECCICGNDWTEGAAGWVLCDTCENVVCPVCTTSLGLIVSDLFYCPPCSGAGQSAAATVGGAVATAVAACTELETLPLSFKAVQRILSNLCKSPDEVKYRRLRLENPSVRKYVDLDPVLRILTSIGFVRTEEERAVEEGSQSDRPPVEQILVLEGDVDVGQIKELLEILDGLSRESVSVDRAEVEKVNAKKNVDATTISSEGKEESNAADDGDTCVNDKPGDSGKRSTESKPLAVTNDDEPNAKKRKQEM
mmetsp:Transcript_26094/g.75342  ORF Transcript_26094/g.75342 Transcript_26094/m.75342 type:complete len:266 (-) Transcript_26094:141-938(-)|eukprot:CAMPEP_0181045118 /NCGR_PEP_ID=MMETSP1070-20121207/13633_1 /TAXON_ID=265543 /ORGANISM="Minutocellus polymorphus, Strain NH13" /LENGTH=265 /DNA_ID=CAMNT_0023123617 /DNA_START=123 /DNA_END=920 /DNA_ORIENTATION=+